MSLSLNLKVWWLGIGFVCEKCGTYCDGENSLILANGVKMVRWCDECGHLEEGRKDSHAEISNIDLLPPENMDFLLLNPVISKRRNMPY